MRGYNRIFLIGRLGQDPDIRIGKSGQPWTMLGVATNRARKEGEVWVEETDWHDVKVFGNDAEKVQKMGCKGAVVAIEGSLVYESWTDELGNKKRKARVIASRVQFVANYRRPGDGVLAEALGAPGGAGTGATLPGLSFVPTEAETTIESEIPF
jgi:single-strand DNA-binding protein